MKSCWAHRVWFLYWNHHGPGFWCRLPGGESQVCFICFIQYQAQCWMDVIEWLHTRHLPDKIKISMIFLFGCFTSLFMALLSLYCTPGPGNLLSTPLFSRVIQCPACHPRPSFPWLCCAQVLFLPCFFHPHHDCTVSLPHSDLLPAHYPLERIWSIKCTSNILVLE